MRKVVCPVCSSPKTKKHGKTAAKTQRWRCGECGATFTHTYSTLTKDFALFLRWLFGKATQQELGCSGRTFRRHCAKFWQLWALPEKTGEIVDVVYVDGLYIAEGLHILIASSADHILGWYLARSENTFAWVSLLGKIVAPRVVVCDGAQGLYRALSICWPKTHIQRCLWHVASSLRRATTAHPKLDAGRELLGLANRLCRLKGLDESIRWIQDYMAWRARWESFLAEQTINPDTHRREWTHRRLVRARDALDRRIRANDLFTFLTPELADIDNLPTTNNRAESINARLREMFRLHRGLSRIRRAQAACLWCYMHAGYGYSLVEILERLPSNQDINQLIAHFGQTEQKENGRPEEFGVGLDWAELR